MQSAFMVQISQCDLTGQSMTDVNHYSELIDSAYILPIRSVVVVDDDFPTLDGLLGSVGEAVTSGLAQTSSSGSPDGEQSVSATVSTAGLDTTPTSSAVRPVPATENQTTGVDISMKFRGRHSEVDRATKLIEACRRGPRPWMVDIHDGKPHSGTNELSLAPSMHHSDLMILDFHLDGEAGDGNRAIEIVRALASNNQFNLVIVYTKGISDDISEVFQQIAAGVTYRNSSTLATEDVHEKLRSLIEEWEIETDQDVTGMIRERVTTNNYLMQRAGQNVFGTEGFEHLLTTLLISCPQNLKKISSVEQDLANIDAILLDEKMLLEYGLGLRHAEMQPRLSLTDLGRVKMRYSTDSNWLRLDRLFLTVVHKNTHPEDLLNKLKAALNDWAPGPHQLLMAKMRAELSEKGVGAEAEVLANQSLQAGWLHQLLDEREDPTTVMTQSINRHWEALGDGVYEEVKLYAKKLFDFFRAEQPRDEVIKKYLEKDFAENERVAQLNHYYSTKPIDSVHLTTGQILEFAVPTPENLDRKQHWICLSPACDLVPGRKPKNSWKSRLGDATPFLAVQLHDAKERDALKDVNQNRFVFMLDEHGCITAKSFTADSKSTSVPIWEQMFALNAGRFIVGESGDSRPRILLQRILEKDVPTETDDGAANEVTATETAIGSTIKQLVFTTVEVRVVCQLRYEYALNLLQRLGSALSRVGLDFRTL